MKTSKTIRILLILIAFAFIPGPAADVVQGSEQEQKGGEQTVCPVMGGKIMNKDLYADYEGKRIYFCCAGCPATFEKNPEKYMEKLEEMGQTPEDAPKSE